MNLRDLEYIVNIVETGSFAAAAKACHVSASTLSIQLKKVEDYLGVQIFERTNKSVRLTDTGQEIYRHAKAALDNAKEIKNVAAQSKNIFAGKLYLGAFPTLAPYLFPSAVPKLKKALPKAELFLVEEKTEVLVQKLKNGDIDAALLAMPVDEKLFSHIRLFWEPFYLAVPKSHKLAGKKTIKADDIKTETVLLLEDGHCLRGQALEFCAKLGVGESGSYRATSLETLRNMVIAGAGITIIPKLAVPQKDENIVYVPFASPEPGREIALYWRTASAKEKLFQKLAEILT